MHLLLLLLILIGVATTIILIFLQLLCVKLCVFFPSAVGLLISSFSLSLSLSPQWGAADAEIKVPSDENTELKRSPFEA